MKNLIYFLTFLMITNLSYSQKKVLVEVFTNSHCGPCGSSYNYMNNNINNKPIKDNFIYIYNHVSTYNDDKLYQESKNFSNPRAGYYGNISGTPTYFVDGKKLSNYTTIESEVNSSLNKTSLVSISSNVEINSNTLIVKSNLMPTTSGTFKINYAIVEDVVYKGRNGVENHKNVMRTINPTVSGENISLKNSEELQTNIELTIDPIWNTEKISLITWLQDPNSKEILNSTIVPFANFKNPQSIEHDSKIGNNMSNVNFTKFRIFPNPTNNIVSLNFMSNVSGDGKVEMIDINGNITYKTNINVNLGINNFNLESNYLNLPKGVYILNLIYNNSTLSQKVILE